jgi:hypothetical protein
MLFVASSLRQVHSFRYDDLKVVDASEYLRGEIGNNDTVSKVTCIRLRPRQARTWYH